jgi:hypothetical protein
VREGERGGEEDDARWKIMQKEKGKKKKFKIPIVNDTSIKNWLVEGI